MLNKALLVTVASALCIFVVLVVIVFTASPTLLGFNQVVLRAKPWNDGDVHIWHTLVETEATFTDVREGTRCQRLDRQTHQLIGSPPPIFYYHVDCNGVIGYVEIDQVR